MKQYTKEYFQQQYIKILEKQLISKLADKEKNKYIYEDNSNFLTPKDMEIISLKKTISHLEGLLKDQESIHAGNLSPEVAEAPFIEIRLPKKASVEFNTQNFSVTAYFYDKEKQIHGVNLYAGKDIELHDPVTVMFLLQMLFEIIADHKLQHEIQKTQTI